MTTPLILVLAALAVAQGKPGMVTEPGTNAPRSVDWGPDYKKRVQDVFDKLLMASGYDNKLDEYAHCPDGKRGKTQLIYTEQFHTIEGSPAVAVPACVPPNEKNFSIVAAGYALLEFVHNEHELAFILGHEISHLAEDHGGEKVRKRMEFFDAWYASNEKEVSSLPAEEVVKRFSENEKIKADLEAHERSLERRADANGLNLMTIGRYDRNQASVSLQRAQDWLWAVGQTAPDLAHDPLWVRSKQLHEWQTGSKLKAGGEAALKMGSKGP